MNEFVTVKTSEGILRGKSAKTSSGIMYYSFQGIPYAKPPVGPLRFKPPQPLSQWDGIKDALGEGNICSQINMKGQYKGSEDCLYLNVYSPKSTSNGNGSKAVMVWIHGGGFTMGSGNSDRFGPEFLLEKDVVVVTINFRLGALGFLSTQDSIIPGNLGLRDQIAALQWIKRNINYFSGNPDNVTVFGESSGGASVHYLILSPLAKDLFQRAIAQSGTALIPGSFSRFSKERTFRLGEVLGCKTNDSQVLLNFFLGLPVKKLIEAQNMALSDEEKRRDVLFPFVPCVEPKVAGYNAVLPDEPKILIKRCSFSEVPFIVGLNSHEGIAFAKDVIQNVKVREEIENDFKRLIPLDMNIDNSSDLAHEVAKEIKTFYFGEHSLYEETIEQFVNVYWRKKSVNTLLQSRKFLDGAIHTVWERHSRTLAMDMELKTDLRYAYAAHETVRLHSFHSSAHVFYYLFCYEGDLNSVKKQMRAEHLPGATHGDELNYLFSKSSNGRDIQAKDQKIISEMTCMWTNFAKTGNPTPNKSEQEPVLWPRYSHEDQSYICIDSELSVKHGLFSERMEFWTQLYKKYCHTLT
ncbi:esterase FE4-like isoform X2 [Schistocerca americana]|uniref:esterase FE4-like isoform X2 n=1 Tax=Schistocerca americana TaxID=7009 RepID=UPI001F4FBD4C|nr:esterase FE4-like isoform X2 [Schistocerca americana]